jgi:hypothetical protein
MEDGLGSKLDSEERKGLKVSVKVFISSLKKEALVDALNSGKNLCIVLSLDMILSQFCPTCIPQHMYLQSILILYVYTAYMTVSVV